MNFKVLCCLAILFCFVSLSARADLRLFTVTSERMLAPMVLPVRSIETPKEALEKYLQNLERSPDLMELFAGSRPFLSEVRFKEITHADLSHQALLMANLPKDYTLDSLRVSNFMDMFKANGHGSFILPIAAQIGLSVAETQEFLKLISQKFSFLVAMGGEDVDPARYNRENLHSRNVVPTRDRYEIQTIKAYSMAENGFLLGVCRGAQISSVALGYQINQHVPLHIGNDVAHANDWHDIKVFKTNFGLLEKIASLNGTLHVNSLHHQSIVYHDFGPLQIAARATDGTTEALEFKNGRGLLLQFHPELMNNALGDAIIARIVQQKNSVQVLSCRSVF